LAGQAFAFSDVFRSDQICRILPGNSPVDTSNLHGLATLDSAFETGTETAEEVDGNSFVYLHFAANHELIFGFLESDGNVFGSSRFGDADINSGYG
jgi:hypothetical protein